MGNNAAYKVVGVSTVKVKIYDGNVRHVPNLRKNLDFLGILEENGFTCSSREGNMKVCKGSLVVMRGEKLSNNLYNLIEDTVASGAVISTAEVADEDFTYL